jgi:hypothetical protein
MAVRNGMGAGYGDKGKVIVVMQKTKGFLSREEINDGVEKHFGKRLENTPLAIAIIDLANEGLLKQKKGDEISSERGHRILHAYNG